ncbi:MAG: hypothetical protein ACXWR1_18490 [Bdellovibrionota bacterium]
MNIIPLLALLPTFAFAAAPSRMAAAHVSIRRSFVQWSGTNAEIRYENVCERDVAIPVLDLRDGNSRAEPGELNCASVFRDQSVTIAVNGVVELVNSDDFGLGVPRGTPLKRTLFTLDVNTAPDFPYTTELQQLTGYQLFSEDLTLRSQIFALSPETQIELQCGVSGCKASGPQSVYRAQVSLLDTN